jgi:hypothetical protein
MENKGKHQYRFKDNPLEEKFAKGWEMQNSTDLRSYGTLEYLLADDSNYPKCDEVSERDRLVAATVIQWLGSPVGQSFIRGIMEDER